MSTAVNVQQNKRAQQLTRSMDTVNHRVKQDGGNGTFWSYYDKEGHGHTVYASEYMALKIVMNLVDVSLLDRATVFDDEGIGFMDIVRSVAESIEQTLPYVVNHFDATDLLFLMVGRPDADEEEPPSVTGDTPLTDAQRLEMVSQFTDKELRKLEHIDHIDPADDWKPSQTGIGAE